MKPRVNDSPPLGRPRMDIQHMRVARVQVLFTMEEYRDFKKLVEEFEVSESRAGQVMIREWMDLYKQQEGIT